MCRHRAAALAPGLQHLERASPRLELHGERRSAPRRSPLCRSSRASTSINMSLSTTKKPFASVLHELADSAYFRRTVLVASAHNMPVESYPWRFSSVISVGSHEEPDPLTFFSNPNPPVEFFGRGVNVEVPWMGGRTLNVSGNSFATPHLSVDLRVDPSKHPELTPFQLKSVLYLTANERWGWHMTDEPDLRAAVAAGVVGSEESFRALLARNRRGRALDLRRQGVVDPPPRRGDRGARLRGRRRRGRGHAPRDALSRRQGDRRLGPRNPNTTRHRGRAERSPLRERRRRGHRLRPEWPDGGSAPARGGRARRAVGARPARADALQPAGDGAARASSPTRPRSPSTCCSRRARRSASSQRQAASSRWSRASRQPSTRSRTSAARPDSACSESSPRRSAQRKVSEDQIRGPGGCTSHPGLESSSASRATRRRPRRRLLAAVLANPWRPLRNGREPRRPARRPRAPRPWRPRACRPRAVALRRP